MPDYKSMYFKLFNKVTDAVEILMEAQKEAEESYINMDDEQELPPE